MEEAIRRGIQRALAEVDLDWVNDAELEDLLVQEILISLEEDGFTG